MHSFRMAEIGDKIRVRRLYLGLTQEQIGTVFGITANAVNQWENGTTRPRPSRLTTLADILQCAAEWLIDDRQPANLEQKSVHLRPPGMEVYPESTDVAYIVGTVEAGAWREAVELPREEWEPMPCERRPEYASALRFGLRVVGPSMNRIYPPGTILDCVKFVGAGRDPREGDHVIVYRRGPGNLMEATVKELIRDGDRWQLWPRSTHPAHQEPIALEHAPDDDENEDLRIVAFVIGSYTRRS